MKNIKIIIEYEGTNYSGWQSQENAITIQSKIEEAIRLATGEVVKLLGSGRTDGGVHALGQVANFYTNSNIPGDKFKYILNNVLPDDISIIDSVEVNLNFHSRFSAKGKKYKYLIYNGEMPRPLFRNFSYHVKSEIDIDKMKQAAKELVGTHDFASFKGRKSVVKSTIRTIHYIEIKRVDSFIEISIEGNSFLRYMVRNIVGTLIQVGYGRIDKEDIVRILSDKCRNSAGITAPAQGLYLERVYYD